MTLAFQQAHELLLVREVEARERLIAQQQLRVVGEGLAAQSLGLRTAGITFAITVAALAAICLTAILVAEARAKSSGST